MPVDHASTKVTVRHLRVDLSEVEPFGGGPWSLAALVVLAAGFVLIGAGNLDLGPIESRLGLAADAEAGLGPVGQLFGRWEPSLLPAEVVPSRVWAWFEGGAPTSASVRWPSAIAGILAGWLLARRVGGAFGARAGLLTGLCWFGSVALIDRSAGAGIDLIAGLGIIGALDRILGKGSDVIAGLWACLAFLAGGWPALVAIALPMVVLGRHGATLGPRFLLPVLATAAAWSAWVLSVAPARVWGEAIALPLTQGPSWLLAGWVVAFGLPWTPFAALVAFRGVRAGWSAPGRALVIGWLQVAGAVVLAGTLIPGLASSARIPALAGLAVASGVALDRAWSEKTSTPALRRWFVGLGLAIVGVWVAIVTPTGIYLAAAVSYYRPIAILLVGLGFAIGSVAVEGALRGKARWSIGAVVAVAVCLKVAHWGVYVPEWNYRFSQGPWGRAIGQWVPPQGTVYTVHDWPPDLAFAIGRPVRQLADPRVLPYQKSPRPFFVLLKAAEFDHWPDEAPRLLKVFAFHDERGNLDRVLARTEEDLARLRLAQRTDE